ncbi:hypothetical protein HZA33_01060 [Candidatus Pacearchaeota archaeon]|nr:hypothetical protein [Candidatus Pacearchaeota archaeon]
MKNKKADLKIQETAFMLLALAMFFALVFVFYTNIKLSGLYAERNRLYQERGVSMLSKLANMPELSSAEGLDYDSIIALRNVTGYDKLFKGLLGIQVVRVYPKKEVITIFDNTKGKNWISYSSYIPLCQLVFEEEQATTRCDIAKLIVYVEQVSAGARK